MKRFMDRIGESVKGRIAKARLTPMEEEIRKYILKEFARNGRPPSSGEIMEGLRLSSPELIKVM